MPDPGIARAARLRRIAGVVCLVLAAAGAGYLWLRSAESSAPASAKPAPTAVPVASAAEVPTELPVVVVPTPPRVRRAAPEVEAAIPPAASTSAGKPVASAPAREIAPSAAPQPAPAQAPAQVQPPQPAPHAPRPAASGPRTYPGSVTLPGGEKIELGGIAWSEEEPRALLNDRIVGVGGYVDGYSVSKIETDRVVLEKDGATIVLTVK
jgi:outer membrane biosynthesis protein TonB